MIGLREARIKANLTQKELAELIGVKRSTIGNLETVPDAFPRKRERTRAIEKLLGLPKGYFFCQGR